MNVFDYMIFDGKVAMIAGKQEVNGVVISSEDMYQNAKAIFEITWKLLPNP